jgi:hypothetical protein
MRNLEAQLMRNGMPPFMTTYPEAAGQTFDVGAPVVLNASGQIAEAATPAASLCGVAAQPANGTGVSRYLPPSTGKPVSIYIAEQNTLFAVRMAGAVQADVGKLVTIQKVTGLWSADRTTAGTFLVTEIDTLNPGAVPIARGYFLNSACQLSKAA